MEGDALIRCAASGESCGAGRSTRCAAVFVSELNAASTTKLKQKSARPGVASRLGANYLLGRDRNW